MVPELNRRIRFSDSVPAPKGGGTRTESQLGSRELNRNRIEPNRNQGGQATRPAAERRCSSPGTERHAFVLMALEILPGSRVRLAGDGVSSPRASVASRPSPCSPSQNRPGPRNQPRVSHQPVSPLPQNPAISRGAEQLGLFGRRP